MTLASSRWRLFAPAVMFLAVSVGAHRTFAAEAEKAAVLKAFTGTWSGKLSASTLDGRLIGTLEGKRRVWWKDGRLHSQENFSGDGLTFAATGSGYVRLGRLYCELNRDGFGEQTFWGSVDGGGIDWTNFLRNNQDFSERIATASGKRHLDIVWYEVMDYQGQRDWSGWRAISAQGRNPRRTALRPPGNGNRREASTN